MSSQRLFYGLTNRCGNWSESKYRLNLPDAFHQNRERQTNSLRDFDLNPPQMCGPAPLLRGQRGQTGEGVH